MKKFFYVIGGTFLLWLMIRDIHIDYTAFSEAFGIAKKVVSSSGVMPVLVGGIVIQVVFQGYRIFKKLKSNIKRLNGQILR